MHGPTHQLQTRIDTELKYPFIEYCYGLPSNATAKIINTEIVSIRSSNEISFIKNALSTIYTLIIDPHKHQPLVQPDGSIGRALPQQHRGQGSSLV